MKTIFNIAISIALGCSCASCSDFLNLTPYSEITAENFYQNEEDFRQAVNGAYEPLRNMYNRKSGIWERPNRIIRRISSISPNHP